MENVTCHISKQTVPSTEAYRGEMLRDSIYHLIRKDYPDFTRASYISIPELNKYRQQYLTGLVREETGEVDALESEVVDAITHSKILSENIEDVIDEKLALGQRIADHIAEFGGSWTFIIIFFTFILVWMGINVYFLASKAFDPYPFILLNLILSCLAAIQAPIIMMSQNRQEQKDRQRSEHDFKVNLKAELEIRMLNEKIDHLIAHQSKRLLEIQQIQADYLEDILKEIRGDNGKN
ncbi:MAG TPA: DUF1003 domain-containing protein [Bacteroidales bacterium]|nr:DUF1003 domain-containing protein [Bacteroidales bacterium]